MLRVAAESREQRAESERGGRREERGERREERVGGERSNQPRALLL
jgi:hypothetical protein